MKEVSMRKTKQPEYTKEEKLKAVAESTAASYDYIIAKGGSPSFLGHKGLSKKGLVELVVNHWAKKIA